MSTALASTVSPKWLSLREPADHRARSRCLADRFTPQLPPGDVVIHDLGSGTGSMARWLAPQLPRAQRWVLHDLDPVLLAQAIALSRRRALDESAITLTVQQHDVTELQASDLSGATLVTTSALLDLLTAEEVIRIASACVSSGCAALFTLSVTGRVELTPRHSLDAAVETAFNAHQRRTVDERRLLGPDAVTLAVSAFQGLGAEVLVADTPWLLEADDAELILEWLNGWVGAACEQQGDLVDPARGYLRQRRAEAASGRLRVRIGHADLLAMPARLG